MVKWKHAHRKGKSCYYHLDRNNIPSEYSFFIHKGDESHKSIRISTVIKDINGDIEEQNEKSVVIPKSSSLSSEIIEEVQFISKLGTLCVYISFNLENSDYFLDQSSSSILKELHQSSIISSYEKKVNSLKPILLDSEDKECLWGRNGILDHLSAFSNINPDPSIVISLKSCENIISSTAYYSNHFRKITENTLQILMGQYPKYVSHNGDIVALSRDNGLSVPLAGVMICQPIDSFIKGTFKFPSSSQKSRILFIETLEVCLIDLCGVFADISSSEASNVWINYVCSSSFFVSSYFKSRMVPFLDNIRCSYCLVGRNSLLSITNRFFQEIIPVIFCPNQIRLQFDALFGFLMLSSFQISVIQPLIDIILSKIDFMCISSWAFSNGIAPLSQSEYIHYFPEYGWPFIKTLDHILENYEDIINRKTTLLFPVPVDILTILLKKINFEKNLNFSESKITKISENQPETEIKDHQSFILEDPSLEGIVITVPNSF